MLKPILLVEDDARDLELTLMALERSQLANEVIVMRDGAQALDYLLREGDHADRQPGNPAVVLLDLKLPKINGLEVLQKVRGTEGLWVADASISVADPTGASKNLTLTRSSGTATDGVWSADVDLPTSAPRGTWTVGQLTAHDAYGNLLSSSTGLGGSLAVTGAIDTVGSKLVSVTPAVATVDTSAGRTASSTSPLINCGTELKVSSFRSSFARPTIPIPRS